MALSFSPANQSLMSVISCSQVYAIAFLMTKARVNGRERAEVSLVIWSWHWHTNGILTFFIPPQALYSLATSKYLSYLVAAPDPIIRAQGLLLLTIYALHMPFQENIISLSSWTMRFCIMAQLHLAETEPQPTDADTLLQIQHRRKIFWCAYAIDRAVCSSFDFPTSIPDNHITVAVSTPRFLDTLSCSLNALHGARSSRMSTMIYCSR